MTSSGQRNAARPRRQGPRRRSARTGGTGPETSADQPLEWIWGRHAVLAALANPDRARRVRLLASLERSRDLGRLAEAAETVEILGTSEIARALPPGAVHQGLALRAAQPAPIDLADLAGSGARLLLMLDQVTDPQNVGAIFRSAAAFGAGGIILQDRHAPSLGGVLAKAAAGAVDRLPHVRTTNLSRALERLEAAGWRSVGLDGAAKADLADALDGAPIVLVLGSEGEGLRRLVAEHCDTLARIPMPGGFESLNVSAAAAVALYEARRRMNS
jgi:23S rRNA (guanosine2251-2'-O)-methyltransferase